MSQNDRQQAQFHIGCAKEHQQGKSSDDSGQDQRQQDEPAEQRFAREVGAIERQRCRDAEGQRNRHRRKSNQQTIQD